jgi:hypothetical protein
MSTNPKIAERSKTYEWLYSIRLPEPSMNPPRVLTPQHLENLEGGNEDLPHFLQRLVAILFLVILLE